MCGRYSLTTPPDVLAAMFRLTSVPAFPPRYNIAPTQDVPIIRERRRSESADSSEVKGADAGDAGKVRTMEFVRWGFVPFWTDDPSIGSRMINARAETASSKPAFRKAFRSRRCLIPAGAFYEWKKPREGSSGSRSKPQPYAIRRQDGQPLALAGLWETWHQKEDTTQPARLETCTILTTEPNELIQPLHNRMPAIIDPRDYDRWLDPEFDDVDALQLLLRPAPAEQLVAYPVSNRINRAEYEGPECLEPLPDQSSPADSAGPKSRNARKHQKGHKSDKSDDGETLFGNL